MTVVKGTILKTYCPVNVGLTLTISTPCNMQRLPPFAAENNLALISTPLLLPTLIMV